MKKQASAYIEILFENRNKEYGAYELRTNYENRLVKSFGLAIIIAGFFFLIPYVLTRILTAKHDGGIILTTIPYDLTKKYVIEKPKLSMAVSSARAKNVSSNSSYKVVEKVEEKKPVQQKPEDPVSSSENKGV